VFFAASKQVYTPRGYKTPLFPFWPCVGVLVTLFLIGTLGPASWERWAYILAAGLVFYAAFDLFDRKWGGHKGVGEFSKAQLEREDLGVASMAALEEGAAGKAGGGEEAGAPLDTSTSKDTGNVEVGVAVSGGK
jgi:APA family basic amino acid/polyamine antiporter